MFRRLALALIAVALLAGCKSELYSDLQESEANEMVAVLLRNGIDAERRGEPGALSVVVEEDQFARAVDLLAANGLPRESFDSIGTVFEKEGLISSPTEERARFIYALSQELSDTVSQIDGVLSARIHVVLPDNDPLRQDLSPSSASVFMRYDRAIPIDSLIPQIKLLVANSIEGLVYDNVSVAMFPVEIPEGAKGAGGRNDQRLDLAAAAPFYVGRPWWVYPLAALAVLSLIGNGALFWLWRREIMATVIR